MGVRLIEDVRGQDCILDPICAGFLATRTIIDTRQL